MDYYCSDVTVVAVVVVEEVGYYYSSCSGYSYFVVLRHYSIPYYCCFCYHYDYCCFDSGYYYCEVFDIP